MVAISKFSYQNPRYLNLLMRRNSITDEVETTVKDVLKNVKEKGDKALFSYMNLQVPEKRFRKNLKKLSKKLVIIFSNFIKDSYPKDL